MKKNCAARKTSESRKWKTKKRAQRKTWKENAGRAERREREKKRFDKKTVHKSYKMHRVWEVCCRTQVLFHYFLLIIGKIVSYCARSSCLFLYFSFSLFPSLSFCTSCTFLLFFSWSFLSRFLSTFAAIRPQKRVSFWHTCLHYALQPEYVELRRAKKKPFEILFCK